MRQFDRRTSALSEPKHHVEITSSLVEETGIRVGGGKECRETEEMPGCVLSHCTIYQTKEMTE